MQIIWGPLLHAHTAIASTTNQLEKTNISSPRQQTQSIASAPPIIMNRNQAFSATGNTSSINNQQLQKNVSYQVGILEQGAVPLTTAAESNYEDDENMLISNQAYERNRESHYEDIVWIMTKN